MAVVTDSDRLDAMARAVLCARCSRETARDGSCSDCGMSAAELKEYEATHDAVGRDFDAAKTRVADHVKARRKPTYDGPSEAEILAAIRLALGKDRRVDLMRNNVGVLPAATRTGTRPLAYGLGVGSSDLIGLVQCAVHPDARPNGIARFLALEVKTPVGRATPEQIRFIARINARGGYACIVRSVEDAIKAVDAAARGEVAI